MLQDRMTDRMASLEDRGISFPTQWGRRGLIAAVGAAGLYAATPALLRSVVSAHGHRPQPFPRTDKMDELRIRLDQGEGVFAVGPHGILWGDDCDNGQWYPGPTVIGIVSPEDGLSFTATGPEISFDPIDVEPAWPSEGGRDWIPWVAAIREPLRDKRRELIELQNILYRSFPVALNRSAINDTVFALKDSINDSDLSRGTQIGCPRPAVPAQPTAVPTLVQTSGEQRVQATVVPVGGIKAAQAGGECFPPARTVFAPEGDANIDGTDYHADLRDLPSCVRFVGTWELGIDDPRTPTIIEGAHNFKVRMPRGWSMVVSPTSVAVHREGGRQVDFVDGQVVIVDGSFVGGIGMYEGFAGLTLTDWAPPLADQRLVIQRQHAIGKSNVNVVKFQG